MDSQVTAPSGRHLFCRRLLRDFQNQCNLRKWSTPPPPQVRRIKSQVRLHNLLFYYFRIFCSFSGIVCCYLRSRRWNLFLRATHTGKVSPCRQTLENYGWTPKLCSWKGRKTLRVYRCMCSVTAGLGWPHFPLFFWSSQRQKAGVQLETNGGGKSIQSQL